MRTIDFKPDGQPHVITALRLNKKNPGKYKAGDTVTYVICEDEDDKKKATERAFHPSEVAREKKTIDLDYYFRNQLIPVISRLLDPIEGTDEQMIAERLGLDPKGFKSKTSERLKAEREAEQVFESSLKFRKFWSPLSKFLIDKIDISVRIQNHGSHGLN